MAFFFDFPGGVALSPVFVEIHPHLTAWAQGSMDDGVSSPDGAVGQSGGEHSVQAVEVVGLELGEWYRAELLWYPLRHTLVLLDCALSFPDSLDVRDVLGHQTTERVGLGPDLLGLLTFGLELLQLLSRLAAAAVLFVGDPYDPGLAFPSVLGVDPRPEASPWCSTSKRWTRFRTPSLVPCVGS